MDLLIELLAMFGLAFFLKESDGPWDSMARLRQHLLSNPEYGVFFYKLFSCYLCVGFHAGWMVYLLYKLRLFFILWGLAGGTISLILDGVVTKLHALPIVLAPKQTKPRAPKQSKTA